MSHAKTIRRFFKDLERIDFEAVAAHCADDCRYEDVPVGDAATAIGPAASGITRLENAHRCTEIFSAGV